MNRECYQCKAKPWKTLEQENSFKAYCTKHKISQIFKFQVQFLCFRVFSTEVSNEKMMQKHENREKIDENS